jgi:YidC/Oxa1 family membrane protein insertase
MDNRRVFLFAALVFVGFLIYQAWMQDYGPKPEPVADTTATQTTPTASTAAGAAAAPAVPGAVSVAAGQEIHVRTDVLDLVINTAGGDIRRAELLAYPDNLKTPDQHVRVLDDRDASLLLMQSGLQASSGTPGPGADAIYSAAANHYELAPGAQGLDVTLSWQNAQGLKVDKTYHLTRGSYQIGLSYSVLNQGSAAWSGGPYTQWQSRYTPVSHGMFSAARYDYERVALYGADGYRQYEFTDLVDKPLSETQPNGWAAVVQHYFVAAIIPAPTAQNLYYAKSVGEGRFITGVSSPAQSVAAGASASFSSSLFVGPKLQSILPAVTPGLELTVDYGKLTILAQPIFWVLEHIERLLRNWGWSILLLTVLFKALTYKLNEISGRSVAKMRQVQPRIKSIQERYADDRQRMSQAMMELYKKEKINPVAGCLPIAIQIPVFFSLYKVLFITIEMRHAPFYGWIHDLSAQDPTNIFTLFGLIPFDPTVLPMIGSFMHLGIWPLIMGVTMWVQMKLNPAPPDPTQQMIFNYMPIIFTFMLGSFPVGLVIYWAWNNTLSVMQQSAIMHRHGAKIELWGNLKRTFLKPKPKQPAE